MINNNDIKWIVLEIVDTVKSSEKWKFAKRVWQV
jgi:hypothetical protein